MKHFKDIYINYMLNNALYLPQNEYYCLYQYKWYQLFADQP